MSNKAYENEWQESWFLVCQNEMGLLLQTVFTPFFCRHSKLRITYPNDKCRSFPLLIWQCNCTQEFVHNLNYWMKKFLDYWNRLSFDNVCSVKNYTKRNSNTVLPLVHFFMRQTLCIRIPNLVVFIFTSLPPMKQYLKRNWIKAFWRGI